MEIRKFSDIIGVIAMQDIVEGRMVMLATPPADTGPFTLWSDMAGCRLPRTAAEALKAKYVSGHAMDNRKVPIYDPMPAYNWIVRNYGFESGQRNPDADNLPMTGTTVHLTHLSNTVCQTITSGTKCLAYGGGVYTITSGCFVYSSDLETIGAQLTVEHAAGSDRGKLKYHATGTIGVVEEWNSDNFTITVRTLAP